MDKLEEIDPLTFSAPPSSGTLQHREEDAGPGFDGAGSTFEDELGEDFLSDLREKNDIAFEPSPQRTSKPTKVNLAKPSRDMLDFDLTDFGLPVGKVKKGPSPFDWTADLDKGDGFDLFKAFEIPSSPEKFRPENSPHVKAIEKGIEDLPAFKDPTEGSANDHVSNEMSSAAVRQTSSPSTAGLEVRRHTAARAKESFQEQAKGQSLDQREAAFTPRNAAQEAGEGKARKEGQGDGHGLKKVRFANGERQSSAHEDSNKKSAALLPVAAPPDHQRTKEAPPKDVPSTSKPRAADLPLSQPHGTAVPKRMGASLDVPSTATAKDRALGTNTPFTPALGLSRPQPAMTTAIGNRLASSLASASNRLASSQGKPLSLRTGPANPEVRSDSELTAPRPARDDTSAVKEDLGTSKNTGSPSLKRTLPMPEREVKKDSRLETSERGGASLAAAKLLSPKSNQGRPQNGNKMATSFPSAGLFSSRTSRLQSTLLRRPTKQMDTRSSPPRTSPNVDQPSLFQETEGPPYVPHKATTPADITPLLQNEGKVVHELNQCDTAEMDISPRKNDPDPVRSAPPLKSTAEELITKGEIAKKADDYTKELDQMYASLKKKHEEAKDLLVQALINNNRLQMLHNPMTEDKLCAIQQSIAQLFPKERAAIGLSVEE